MNKQDVDTAYQLLGRINEDRNTDVTRSRLNLRLDRRPDDEEETPGTVTRIKKLPLPKKKTRSMNVSGFGSVDPKGETGSVQPYPSDTGWGGKMANLIRKKRRDPKTPEWQKKIVKHEPNALGTPTHMAPESWHTPDNDVDPTLKGRVRTTADPSTKRGKMQQKVVARTIARASGKKTYTCNSPNGQTYTSTMKCPSGHKRVSSMSPTRTQSAMGRVVGGLRRAIGR